MSTSANEHLSAPRQPRSLAFGVMLVARVESQATCGLFLMFAMLVGFWVVLEAAASLLPGERAVWAAPVAVPAE